MCGWPMLLRYAEVNAVSTSGAHYKGGLRPLLALAAHSLINIGHPHDIKATCFRSCPCTLASFPMPGDRHLVPCTWCQVTGSRCLVPGNPNFGSNSLILRVCFHPRCVSSQACFTPGVFHPRRMPSQRFHPSRFHPSGSRSSGFPAGLIPAGFFPVGFT